jgi:hypothetical protein
MTLDDPDLPMKGVLPDKEDLGDFMNLRIDHHRPELRFSFLCPDGWYRQPHPSPKADVRDDNDFLALGVFTPTKDIMPPVVFSVGVRPAPKKGTVAEWLEYQCHLQQLAVERMKVSRFVFGTAVEAVALQGGDIPMKMRVVMFEDGGRLWVLTGMAPVKLWPDAVPVLSCMMVSFELDEPKGQTAPVVPEVPADPPAAQA